MAASLYCFTKRNIKVSVLTVALAVLLSACSSSSDTPPVEPGPDNDGTPDSLMPSVNVDPEGDDLPGLIVTGLNGTPASQLTSPWLANVSLYRGAANVAGGGDATVDLLQYNDTFPVSRHIDFYTESLDTCELIDLGDGDGGGGDGNQPLSVSGGSTVTINTAAGTWFEIQADAEEPGFYDIDNGLPGALPSDAVLSIPGAQFPNVAAYPLAEPVAPVRITPASGNLTAADVAGPFTWEATPGIPGGYVEIVGLAFDGDGNFQGFPIVCVVMDDGEFTMPPEVIEAFANTTFDIESRYQRVIERVDFINNIVFHQRSVVAD